MAVATKTPTRAELEDAKRTAESLRRANNTAKETPSRNKNGANTVEAILEDQTPPRQSKSYGSEKPFSFHNLMRFIGTGDRSLATHEMAVLDKYKEVLNSTSTALVGQGGGNNTFWLPTNFDTYGGKMVQTDKAAADFRYVKAVFEATKPAYDEDEARWLARRRYVKASNNTTSQSAYDDLIGGSLVAPPIQGEVIPLIRPQAAFLAAGATAMTLPPNGRYVAPRITAPPTVQATGESQTTVGSQLGTDQMELTAKKIAGYVILTEEGTAFTSGTLDNIAQMELSRSLGLQLDAYGFYGNGGTNIPNGLTSDAYTGEVINVETAYGGCKGVGADGNQLLPQYGDVFPSLIAERSFNMDGATGKWVLRPTAFATAVSLRADAVTANDQAGPQVDIVRRFSDSGPTSWKGRGVVQSTNINGSYTKGTGTNLSDVFFGIWQYAIFASYGAIQFVQGHNGTTFLNGQTILRGTMFGDVGFQYPWAFLWYPNVLGLGTNF